MTFPYHHIPTIILYIKKCAAAHFNSPAPQSWGVFAFTFTFLLYNSQTLWYNFFMNILKQIFNDHFNNLVSCGLKIRPTVIENVDKMLHCGDFSYGFAYYGCEHCGDFKLVPFRCKSRFCITCGNLYSMQRSEAISYKMINCSHRHCVFTIPEQLRIYFRKDRKLLNCLFHSVRDVILRFFR